MSTYKELTEQYAGLIDKAKDVLAKPQADNRSEMNADEKTEYAKIKADIDDLQERRTAAKELETAIADVDGLSNQFASDVPPQQRQERQRLPQSGKRPSVNRALKTFLGASEGYAQSPEDVENLRAFGVKPGGKSIKFKLPKHRARNLEDAYRKRDAIESGEYRGTDNQTVGTGEHGGFAVAAEVMGTYLDIELLAHGGMYPLARKIRNDNGTPLVVPGVNDTTVKATIVAEAGTTPVSDLTLTDSSISTYKYSSGVQKVSLELSQDSSFDIEALIGEQIGTRFSRGLNEHWTKGTGSGQPQGLFYTSGGAGDEGTVQAAANVWTYEELIDLEHSVDSAYRMSPSCVFMTSDGEVAKLKKIADDNNRPLWLPSLEVGGNSIFDGYPVVVNPDMPSGAGAIGLGFGDIGRYVIREVSEIEVHILDQLYLPDGLIGIVAFGRWGGGCPGSVDTAVKYKVEHASST